VQRSGTTGRMKCGSSSTFPDEVTYLNCANMSPQLRAVTSAGLSAAREKATPWTLRSEDWCARSERLRGLFAQIINTDVDGIALVPAASDGIAVAAANVEIFRGQSIVLLDGEFPSNVFAWRELAARRDASVRTIARGSSGSWTEPLIDAIDRDTAVVSVPNCHGTNGRLVDLTRVAPAVRAAGAALMSTTRKPISLGCCPC
jgi:selenocysteine lyase/cysteine desulfurase